MCNLQRLVFKLELTMYIHVILLLFVNVFAVCKANVDTNYVMKTNGTRIVGRILHTIYGRKTYAAFWKIPYAQPPVQKLRFKSPKYQSYFDKPFYNYSVPYKETCSSSCNEDCLYLSIFTPITTVPTSFPVLVWIHEDSDTHEPDFFIEENVIVVTVSFRISIFGFLNTEDSFAEGNMGAKDVLTALRWIRDNISYFNGDMNRVTVFGSGENANIVASLLLSPTGEDLFKRVIIQDRSALSPADYRSYNFELSKKLYWRLKGSLDKFNRTHFYEILRNSPPKKLLFASQGLFDSTEVRDNQRLINSFGPTLEKGKFAFMNKYPIQVYKQKISNNAVEVMIGYTNLNSLYKLEGFRRNNKLLKYLNYNFQYLLPFEGRRDEYGSRMYRKIRRKIMDFYFVNGTVGERSLRRYAKYVSDQVIYPILRQARLHAQLSCNNVYLYRFTFKGSLNIMWNTLLSEINWNGATEGDEICYQFKCRPLRDMYDTVNANERLFIKKISRLFANFVKYGNPTPDQTDDFLGDLKWTTLTSNKPMRALNIGKVLKMKQIPEEKRLKFWDQLRQEFFAGGEFNNDL